MENLEILNAQTSIQAKETYLGSVINYNFMYTQNEAPQAVIFSVGDATEPSNYLSGTYHPASDQFNFNSQNYTGNQGDLLDYIYTRCVEIAAFYAPEVVVIPEAPTNP